MAKNITKSVTLTAEQLQLIVNQAVTKAVEEVKSRKTTASQPTGKKTGKQIDEATISHVVPTIKGSGMNVFLRSKSFKHENGKSRNYRVFIPTKHVGKIKLGKQVPVYEYHKEGKEQPASSVKMTLAAGISRWAGLPNKPKTE